MYKKFIELLTMITDEILEKGSDIDEAIDNLKGKDINLFSVNDELELLEKSKLIGEEEADMVRSILVYLFARETDLELEDIYALVFGRGKRLVWH
ncbi:MAG: hypothetical protein D6726_04435 [Nitrospirae bacterium]|nr:MAG: hypothetical protein D6726_04435 [Nitrospirota bacterium]